MEGRSEEENEELDGALALGGSREQVCLQGRW